MCCKTEARRGKHPPRPAKSLSDLMPRLAHSKECCSLLRRRPTARRAPDCRGCSPRRGRGKTSR
eukprot:138752-Pyramimonas_sp.AAC.1